MSIGQTLNAGGITNGRYYSSWFRRQGDKAVFVCELINKLTADLKVTFQTKNYTDNDPPYTSTLTGEITANTGGETYQQEVSGFKELIRFQFEVTGSSGWVHHRMQEPLRSWDGSEPPY